MKPAPFTYHDPKSVAEAADMLGTLDNARVLAGGQSLMPMTNFRYVMPDHIVDINNIAELSYIRQAKELGFTLAEIRELLELSFAHSDCSHIHQRAEDKIRDIENKIRSLQQMKRSLRKIEEHCKTHNLPADCPLVHTSQRRTPN